MRLILLGKPLSGKGTLGLALAKYFHIPLLSLGDILRKEAAKKSKRGKKIAQSLRKGKLVPQDIVLSLLQKHFTQKNFVLDGFPRTLSQAKVLDFYGDINLVINVSCPARLIFQRLRARQICTYCGSIYGLYMPAKKKDVCDHCKEKLVHREDDSPEALRTRLEIYTKEAQGIMKYYKKKGIYFQVQGNLSIEKLTKQIIYKIESIK